MRANSMCISCILLKQEKKIRNFKDDDKKSEYLHQVLGILHEHGCTKSSPWLAEKINQTYEKFWGASEDYSLIKHHYNALLVEKEADIIRKIEDSQDCLKECIKYASVGNYIDFSAVENVNENTLETLLERAKIEQISEKEYTDFKKDLGKARKMVYLTDNCGEIVLDKIFISFIQKLYPQLHITVIVRGENVLNDATLEDAREIGLTKRVHCIANGNGAPGTVYESLSEEAKQVLKEADVIISKGQGNFESIVGEGFNPYYIFLCKCELFVRRFGLQQYESVFMKEERLHEGLLQGGVLD